VFRESAHVYDLIYEASGKDYAREASDVHHMIQRRRPGGRTLLDVACGTGGHLHHLRQWYDVVGVDIDPEMLGQARRHLPDVTLIEGDMRTFRLGRTFDAAMCLFSSIGYMRSTDELAAGIGAMAGHLVPGGILVVDGWVRPDAWLDGGAATVVVASTPEIKVARVATTRREGVKTYWEAHHLVATSDGIEHLVHHHELTLFAPEEYEAAFAAAGLAVEVVESPIPGRDRYIGTR
jgi:SAM-dependent methyltransferase